MVDTARRADRTGGELVVLYGLHAVAAALANPARPCARLLATDNALVRLAEPAARRPGLALERVRPEQLGRLVPDGAAHQGAVLEAGPLPPRTLDRVLDGHDDLLLLALDQIEDPRNLGAILRSAVAFDVTAVLLPRRGSAPLGGACAKAASGALDMVELIEVASLAQALDHARQREVWIIGLDGEAAGTLADVPAFRRRALVLGAEGRGLRQLTAERCDLLARLEIAPRMESLNVSVAAGIALHHLARTATVGTVAAGGATTGH